MKMVLLVGSLLISGVAGASPKSGLKCTMAYSASSVLSVTTNSESRWLTAGQTMEGQAYKLNPDGSVKETAANFLSVEQKAGKWTVKILDDNGAEVGSFSFANDAGMKVTLPARAAMANEVEDPPKYDKLEVSCFYEIFAG